MLAKNCAWSRSCVEVATELLAAGSSSKSRCNSRLLLFVCSSTKSPRSSNVWWQLDVLSDSDFSSENMYTDFGFEGKVSWEQIKSNLFCIRQSRGVGRTRARGFAMQASTSCERRSFEMPPNAHRSWVWTLSVPTGMRGLTPSLRRR